MRKITLFILLLVLLFNAMALAEALPFVAELDQNKQLERYPSYTIDESTGDWSVHGIHSQDMLNAAEQSSIGELMSKGVCIIYPGIRGNYKSSLMEPVLYVCLLRNTALNAEALSITTGGNRYDFVCTATEIQLNESQNRKGEQFILPLNEDGLLLLRSFAQSGGEVRICGEKQVFSTSIVKSEDAKNNRQRFEARALTAVNEFLTIWPSNYALWDLNAEYWNLERAMMTVVKLETSNYAQDWPELEEETMCIDTGKGTAVKAYQQLLKDNAFFAFTPDSSYGKKTINATCDAQQYFGLTETGIADRTLIECLNGIQQANTNSSTADVIASLSEDIYQASSGTEYVIENGLSIRIDRIWRALSVSPTKPLDPMELKVPFDSSNSLLVVDGEIENISERNFEVSSAIKASMKVNGISYMCIVQSERDEGSAFGSSLLPMGRSRVVVLCEIPKEIEITSAELTIDIDVNSEEYCLYYTI